jgi:hypothetical protein
MILEEGVVAAAAGYIFEFIEDLVDFFKVLLLGRWGGFLLLSRLP